MRIAHASDNGHELFNFDFWHEAARVHFVYQKWDCCGAKFLDEEVGEEVVIAGEVVHVHDLRVLPCCDAGAL